MPTAPSIQAIPLVPIPLFAVIDTGDTWFRVEAQCKDLEGEKPLDYGGFSGGPVFELSNRKGLEGDPEGFTLVGLEFSQKVLREDTVHLRCNFIHEWCKFVDENLGEISSPRPDLM